MIKINLLTVKSRKPIQIPYGLIFMLVGLLCVAGGYVLAIQDDVIEKVTGLQAEQKKLDSMKEEITRAKKVEDEIRDRKRTISNLNQKIDRLSRLSGSDLYKWSSAFSELTKVVPKDTVWITNMRIDTDRRVQLTAFACNEKGKAPEKAGQQQLTKGIQDFLNKLMGTDDPNASHDFYDVFLTSATKNKYEQQDVWRFEVSCRLRRELGGGN